MQRLAERFEVHRADDFKQGLRAHAGAEQGAVLLVSVLELVLGHCLAWNELFQIAATAVPCLSRLLDALLRVTLEGGDLLLSSALLFHRLGDKPFKDDNQAR